MTAMNVGTKVEVVMQYYTKYNNGIQSLRKSDLMHGIDTNYVLASFSRAPLQTRAVTARFGLHEARGGRDVPRTSFVCV